MNTIVNEQKVRQQLMVIGGEWVRAASGANVELETVRLMQRPRQ